MTRMVICLMTRFMLLLLSLPAAAKEKKVFHGLRKNIDCSWLVSKS
uniref:Uncharacterized protein n=1 Tax=Medicago truncatula TaxID=3880 RepID=I3SKM8_MEDTR|nr:unknown [Medicago truncatula]